MSDFGLPERQIIGRVDLQKGMFAILEQPPCKYWNRLEDCPSASPASIGIYWVLIGPLSIGKMYGIFLEILLTVSRRLNDPEQATKSPR